MADTPVPRCMAPAVSPSPPPHPLLVCRQQEQVFSGATRGGGRRDYLGYYHLLGLDAAHSRGHISQDEVKRAFRRAALRWHPDKQVWRARRAGWRVAWQCREAATCDPGQVQLCHPAHNCGWPAPPTGGCRRLLMITASGRPGKSSSRFAPPTMCCGTQTGERHTTEGRWWRCEAGQAGGQASCQVSQGVHILFGLDWFLVAEQWLQAERGLHTKPCALCVPTDRKLSNVQVINANPTTALAGSQLP